MRRGSRAGAQGGGRGAGAPAPVDRAPTAGAAARSGSGPAAYPLWLRDLGVVAVQDVEVVGAASADGAQISAALTAAAREMTTLHVRAEELRAAVRAYPTVGSVSAEPRF